MLCENIFCIYWSNKECSLNEIFLDIQGNCQSCIYVNVDESVLEKQREKLLRKSESTLSEKNYSKRKSFFEKLKKNFEEKK